jgi:serine O-acetyltransferase
MIASYPSVSKTWNPDSRHSMTLMQMISSDLIAKATHRYGTASSKSIVKALVADRTFAMIVYRLMQASHRIGLGPLAMIFNKINVVFGGCIIGQGADKGERFVLLHSNGVVINKGVHVGTDIFLEHQVTIGTELRDCPVLGNGVYVGAGAKILGSVRIADETRVGANAVVIHDVEDGCTVVGIPAKPIHRQEEAASNPGGGS